MRKKLQIYFGIISSSCFTAGGGERPCPARLRDGQARGRGRAGSFTRENSRPLPPVKAPRRHDQRPPPWSLPCPSDPVLPSVGDLRGGERGGWGGSRSRTCRLARASHTPWQGPLQGGAGRCQVPGEPLGFWDSGTLKRKAAGERAHSVAFSLQHQLSGQHRSGCVLVEKLEAVGTLAPGCRAWGQPGPGPHKASETPASQETRQGRVRGRPHGPPGPRLPQEGSTDTTPPQPGPLVWPRPQTCVRQLGPDPVLRLPSRADMPLGAGRCRQDGTGHPCWRWAGVCTAGSPGGTPSHWATSCGPLGGFEGL